LVIMDVSVDTTSILTTVIIAILGWGFKIGRDYVLSKIKSSDNALYVQYMGILADVVFDIVSATMQTTVNAYKQTNGFTPELASQVKKNVIIIARKQLANNLIEYLETLTGDRIENIIDTQVEKAVIQYKVSMNSRHNGGV
jgi:hypothetical protein